MSTSPRLSKKVYTVLDRGTIVVDNEPEMVTYHEPVDRDKSKYDPPSQYHPLCCYARAMYEFNGSR